MYCGCYHYNINIYLRLNIIIILCSIHVNWGDRTLDRFWIYEPKQAGLFHTYSRAGKYKVCLSIRQSETPTGTQVCLTINVY